MSLASPCAACEQQASWSVPIGPSPPANGGTQLVEKPTQRVRLALFFDGTMNNKTNVKARQAGLLPDNIWKAKKIDKASYLNDVSNVARMFDVSPSSDPYKTSSGVSKPYDKFTPIYIEGIGTETLGAKPSDPSKTWEGPTDSVIQGGGLGLGSTGTIAKVHKGLEDALTRLKALSPEFDYIHVDVFGFSRGAAAARHCIHALHSGWADGHNYTPGIKKRLEMSGAVVGDLKVRFAGLYDTVASHGGTHSDDTWELSLDAVKNADQVVQLAAAEEHRANFRLTSIGSGTGTGSCEIYLPGVHCDIGGSYNSSSPRQRGVESLLFWTDRVYGILSSASEMDRMQAEYDWLLKQGWSGTHGNTLSKETIDERPGKTFNVRGDRTGRTNEYCLIPLAMMIDYSKEQGLNFSNPHPVGDPYLQGWQKTLKNYANKKRYSAEGSQPDDWFHRTDQDLPTLRAKYLHFSAYYQDFGEQVTWRSQGADSLKSKAPEYSGTRRTRVIQ